MSITGVPSMASMGAMQGNRWMHGTRRSGAPRAVVQRLGTVGLLNAISG
jgi:hypothetical protein